MSPDDFQAAIDTQTPFRVYLSDGRNHDILDKDTAHVGLTSVVAGVYDENQRFPRWTMFSLANIVSLTPLTPAQLP